MQETQAIKDWQANVEKDAGEFIETWLPHTNPADAAVAKETLVLLIEIHSLKRVISEKELLNEKILTTSQQ